MKMRDRDIGKKTGAYSGAFLCISLHIGCILYAVKPGHSLKKTPLNAQMKTLQTPYKKELTALSKILTERAGFEPAVQLEGRTTV
jgi:hypothetical protein